MLSLISQQEVMEDCDLKKSYDGFFEAWNNQVDKLSEDNLQAMCHDTLCRDFTTNDEYTACFLFVLDEKIVGITSFYLNEQSEDNNIIREAYLSSAIHPKLRAQGFGKSLISFQYRKAQQLGLDRIVASISPQNTASLSRFQRLSRAGLAREFKIDVSGKLERYIYRVPTTTSAQAIDFTLGLITPSAMQKRTQLKP